MIYVKIISIDAWIRCDNNLSILPWTRWKLVDVNSDCIKFNSFNIHSQQAGKRDTCSSSEIIPKINLKWNNRALNLCKTKEFCLFSINIRRMCWTMGLKLQSIFMLILLSTVRCLPCFQRVLNGPYYDHTEHQYGP